MKYPEDQSQKSAGFVQLAKTFAEMSALIGAELFVVGWSYLYGYYQGFGLRANELGFSVQAILIYSLPALQTTTFLIGFAIFVVAVWVAQRGAISRILSQPPIALVLVGLVGVLSSTYAVGVGRKNAARDSLVGTSTLPYVKLDGAQEEANSGCSLDEWNYRLLLRASGQIYVVLPVDETRKTAASGLRICSFPETRVRATRLQVSLGRR
jgi:hypothetical protein